MALKLFYTFNNQDSKDYSENGLIGTDTSITYSAADVGYNAVFNADADKIQVGSFTALNGLTEVSFYFRAKFAATTGTKYVFYKNGQFNATFDGTTLTINIIGATGTATVTHTPTLGTYYQYHANYVHNGIADDLSLYVDGVNVDSTTTQGALISNSNVFYLGGDGGGVVDTARFEMNEFKVFSNVLTLIQRTTHLANINGLICSIPRDVYELGDILVSKPNETNKGYAIVTYVADNEIRIQPLNNYVTQSDVFSRIGHLWDTTRQYSVQVTSTGINFYNGVSLSSQAFTDAKLVHSTTLSSEISLDGGSIGFNVDNAALVDNNFYSINPTSNINLTGFVAQTYARRIVLTNRSAIYTVTIINESSSSTGANRFDLTGDFTLEAGKTIELFYDALKSRWRIINDSKQPNINFIFVNSLNDLPNPSGGVITLLANTTYFICTEIDLDGDRLVCGANTTIIGGSSENCRIKSTGLTGTALITSVYSLPLRNITIEADIALDLDGDGTTTALDWFGVNFTDCGSVGTIKDYTNFIMADSAFLNSGDLTFDGTIGTIGISQCLFDCSATNTVFILPATLTITRRFRVIYSSFVIGSGETGINVNASATIPTESYILDTVNFSGAGTYLAGLDHTSNDSLFINCKGITNSAVNGQLYMQGNATATTVSATNTFYKVAGTTTASADNSKFSHSNNRLTCDAVISRKYLIQANLSFTAGNNNVCEFGFYDSQLVGMRTPSKTKSTANGAGRAEGVTFFCVLQMSSGDFLEIHAANTSAITNITVEQLNFVITEIR
jgi:hypothetical protein